MSRVTNQNSNTAEARGRNLHQPTPHRPREKRRRWVGSPGSSAVLLALAAACQPSSQTEALAPAPAEAAPAEAPPAPPTMTDNTSDICGFSDAVELSGPAEDGLLEVPANHPHIFYMGRVDCSDPSAPSFAYPGASIRVRFSGSRLDMTLNDHGGSTPTSTNYYGVSVDQSPPFALAVNQGTQTYTLAKDLPPGEHEVEIFKRTESNHGSGKASFLGFRLSAGGNLLPVASKPRRLEFIGDSITCGYGNELSTDNPENAHYTTKNSNAQQAYGAIVARELGAEYLAVAASGRGISRNYGGEPGTLVPELHKRALPDEDGPWDFARYQPDVTVINLGTNDYSTPGVDRAKFRELYQQFLLDLRQRYPSTLLIVAIGPMLNDAWPPGEQVLTKIREDLGAVLKARSAAGEQKLQLLEFDQQSPPFGEDWHPTRATHEKMANKLVAHIKSAMAW